MPEPIYAALGAKVRRQREELRMTQAELSARIGLSRASVANIEGGRQAVLLHQFLALASALSTPPLDLLPAATPASGRADLPEGVRKFMEAIEGSSVSPAQ